MAILASPAPGGSNSVDLLQARRHLALLGYQDGDLVFFRRLSGKGLDAPPENFKVKLEAKGATPKGLKESDGRRGLYVVVNGGGQTDADVQTARALFCEWDDLPLERQQNLWEEKGFPRPSFQVRTRKSIHCYWVFEPPLPIELWRPLQTQLIQALGADPANKNPSRVFRLAGSWHVEAGLEPIRCELINETDRRYSLSEIQDALDLLAPRQEPAALPSPGVSVEGNKVTIDLGPSPTPRPKPAAKTGGNGGGGGLIPPIPLERCISKKNQGLINSGAPTNRNATGAGLARELVGTANLLESENIPYTGDPRSLFLDYCRRCPQDDWEQREWDKIWEKAKKDNPPRGSLDLDKIQNCLGKWERENGGGSKKPKKANQKDPLQVYNSDGAGNPKSSPLVKLKENTQALRFIKGLWGGKLAYNVRSLEIELEGKPIDCDAIHIELADKHNANITKDRAVACVYYLAKEKEYDPFLDYLKTLENLPSDFTKANLASNLFGTEDPYHCEILWLFLLAVVKRAYEPGCKWDNALVLHGRQDLGKTSFFRALVGGQFFSDGMDEDITKTDNLRKLHNHVVLEWGELESFTAKTYAGKIKNFLSRQEDSFRLPYARELIKHPRRSVIVGTVNETEFLTDTTGNRRFMVLPVTWILDPVSVAKIRGEIFAPVIRDYLENWQGEDKFLELPSTLKARQAQENESYLHGDILQDAVRDAMDGLEGQSVPMVEILQKIQKWFDGKSLTVTLNLDNVGTQRRIGKILNQYGWGKVQRRIDGKNTKLWEFKGEKTPV